MIPKNWFLTPVAVLNGPIRLLDRKRNRVLAFPAALCGGWDAAAPLRCPEYSLCPVCVCDLSFHWHKKASRLHLPLGSSDAGDSDSAESVGTHRLGAKNNRNGFPPSSGGRRLEAGGWDPHARVVGFWEGRVLAARCVLTGESTRSPLSLLIRAVTPSWGPTLMTWHNPNYLPKAPPSNAITLELGLPLMNFGAGENDTISP